MKLSRYYKRVNDFLLLVVLFFICIPLVAKPLVDRANLRYGFSPRIKRFSWGILSCRIQNPDSKPYNVEIRFVDANRGAINQKSVFADSVYVPAKTVINYKAPVMTEDAEEYRLEVFIDGREQKKSDSFIISLISGNSTYLVILNDSEDVSLGAFATAPQFKGKYALSNFMARTPPAPWILLKKAAGVVIVQPDFSKYTAEAYQAILDYVQQGGNVVFADPQGVIAASKTPLSVLLPVKPLRIRKISKLDSLSRLIPEFKSFKEPTDFLESAPVGEGINLVEKDGMPVFRWKRYGLGTCRFAAVPITKIPYDSSVTWYKILSMFIAHQTISNNLASAVPALDEMTGFSVPGIDKVRTLFFIYFLLMVIPLGLGIFLKRTGLAWIITGLITVCFSVYILKSAASSHSKQSGTFLSFIETAILGNTASPGEGWYGIFSTSDTKLTIKANNEQTSLSAIPPPDNIMAMFKNAGQGGLGTKSFASPTEVKTKNALREINNLVLNSNASRQFYASYNAIGSEKIPSPVIQYKKTGFEFNDWDIPEGVKPYAAWLQFANGIVPLAIVGNKVVAKKSAEAVFASDTTLLSVQNFMLKGWKHSSPMLVLVENSDKTYLDLPGKIVSHGKRITVASVQEVSEEKVFSVPPQSVLMTPGDTSTRLVMNGNEIKPEVISRSDSNYVFRYQLPPLFATMKAKEITVDFSYMNEGGNVEIKPVLVVGQILNKKFVPANQPTSSTQPQSKNKRKKRKNKRNKRVRQDREGIKGISGELKNGKLVFTNVQDCLKDGTGFIALKIKIKRKNLPMGERLRANKWSLDKLDITVTGAMPESAPTFKF